MLNWVEIGTIGWPRHAVDSCLMKEGVDSSCPMRSGVVVLKHSIRSNLLKTWDDQRLQYFFQIPLPIKVSIYVVQRRPVVRTYSSPDHHRPSPEGNVLLDDVICQPLSGSPPDAISSVSWVQAKPGLIAEHDVGPLSTIPPCMRIAPGSAVCPVVLSQSGSLDWTASPQIGAMKAIASCLRTDGGVSGCPQMTSDNVGGQLSVLCSLATDVTVFPRCRLLWPTRAWPLPDSAGGMEPFLKSDDDRVRDMKSASNFAHPHSILQPRDRSGPVEVL